MNPAARLALKAVALLARDREREDVFVECRGLRRRANGSIAPEVVEVKWRMRIPDHALAGLQAMGSAAEGHEAEAFLAQLIDYDARDRLSLVVAAPAGETRLPLGVAVTRMLYRAIAGRPAPAAPEPGDDEQ